MPRDKQRSIEQETSASVAFAGARRDAQRRVKRFYKAVTIAPGGGGDGEGTNSHAICLDGKPVRTPGRRALAAPAPELARALADEWAAQGDTIDPATMPLTRLANTIIDGVAAAQHEV